MCFTYFLPDGKKEGGQYQNVTGTVKKIDPYHRVIFLSDGTKIGFDDIVDIAGLNFNGEIQGHMTYFYGICGNCNK